MIRRLIALALVGSGCSAVNPSPGDSGTGDGGAGDGAPELDAGAPDAGPLWLTLDGGGCAPSPFATALELASTPRADPTVEGLGIEATGAFICDQGTYQRIAADLARLQDPGGGSGLFGIILEHAPWSLGIRLDDAGIDAARAGQYRDWDCLNFTYRVTQLTLYPGISSGWLSFHGAYDVRRVASLYAALPNVVSTELNTFGVCAACGCVSDACLEIDGGTLTWLGFRDDQQCSKSWFLVTSLEDGGFTVERPDAGEASAWRRAHPTCARHLYGFALADGGIR